MAKQLVHPVDKVSFLIKKIPLWTTWRWWLWVHPSAAGGYFVSFAGTQWYVQKDRGFWHVQRLREYTFVYPRARGEQVPATADKITLCEAFWGAFLISWVVLGIFFLFINL